ncbi:MAG: hypothetical protein WB383_09035 [Acidimicrobiales bacterium]
MGAETGNIAVATCGAIVAVPAVGSIPVAVRELLIGRDPAPARPSEVGAEG